MELEFRAGFFKKLNFRQIEFSLKVDFLKIEFQNRGIFLNSFKQGYFAGKFRRKGYFAILTVSRAISFLAIFLQICPRKIHQMDMNSGNRQR